MDGRKYIVYVALFSVDLRAKVSLFAIPKMHDNSHAFQDGKRRRVGDFFPLPWKQCSFLLLLAVLEMWSQELLSRLWIAHPILAESLATNIDKKLIVMRVT